MTDTTETVMNLAARTLIADLIHTYALNIRRGNGPACVELFVEDGVFEICDAPLDGDKPAEVRARLEGQQAILQYLEYTASTGARMCPMIQNILVEVNGYRARASSVMTTTVWPNGDRLIGEYDDTFIFDGQWRFCQRVFRILGQFSGG